MSVPASEGEESNLTSDSAISPENSRSAPSEGNAQFAIQIGAFLDQNAADQKIIDLKKMGFEPYIFQTKNSKDQILYAVRIGQFDSYPAAAAQFSLLKDRLDQPAIITRYDSLDIARSGGSQPADVILAQTPEESVPEHTDSPQDNDLISPDKPMTLEALQAKLRTLETEIGQLKDESGVRQKLRISEEEARNAEEDILEAAGGQYTLTKAGNIQFSYGLTYSYSEYDAIRASTSIEDVSNHTISNSFNASYGVKDNLTLGTGIPFVYKYNQVGTIYEEDVTDFGDLNLNWKWQPVKSTSDLPTIIAFGGFTVPVGRSPYEIQVGNELSTSSGFYSTHIGVSVSQTTDPVVVFGSMNVSYPFSTVEINQKRPEGILDEIDPGAGIGVGVGMAYALSYTLNLNMSFGYSYSFETEYYYKNAPDAVSSTSASADLSLGVGYRFSRIQNMNFKIGIPLTESGSFSVSFSTPIEFEL